MPISIAGQGEVGMNFWQGLALGFLAGSLFVMFALPWLQRKFDPPA
jgi:hypothetical protein